MTFKEFQIEATRTCPDLGSLQQNLIHMILGIRSEIREYIQNEDYVNAIEELGDLNWYVANALALFEVDLKTITIPSYIEEFLSQTGRAAIANISHLTDELIDICKKDLAYNKPYSDSKVINFLLCIFTYSIDELKDLNELTGHNKSMNEVLSKIIQKLKKRFPDKFDANLAINRDHQAERKILEE